ncbi:hypothetical protein [Aggregatibacter sp.]
MDILTTVNPILTAVISILTAVISILALLVSCCSYRNSKKHQEKSNDLSALNIVTQLQIEISKKQISLIDQKLETDEQKLEFNAKIEDFLNLLELLSIYILSANLDENLMKVIYKEVIIQAIKQNHKFFGPASKYKNIKKLHDHWTSDSVAQPKK